MQKTKGVSLIVLAITIIVMTILAGAIIITLSDSGLIDKASEAVTDTNIATVKEIANMAWVEAYLENRESGKTELDTATVQAAINTAFEKNKITEEDYKGYTMEITDKGVEFVSDEEVRYKALNPTGTIPEGATYTTGRVWVDGRWDETNKVTYVAGDAFPETSSTGDLYIFGDYVYSYKCESMGGYMFDQRNTTEGWGVLLTEDLMQNPKTQYGDILNTINNKPITSVSALYSNASTITVAPKIPDTVTNMDATFINCQNLVLPDGWTLPKSLVKMNYTFSGCTNLALPEGFNIPSGVTSMSESFVNCLKITLPEGFEIPTDVENMLATFAGCKAISGTITIHANPTDYQDCLSQTSITEILGNTNLKTELLATK